MSVFFGIESATTGRDAREEFHGNLWINSWSGHNISTTHCSVLHPHHSDPRTQPTWLHRTCPYHNTYHQNIFLVFLLLATDENILRKWRTTAFAHCGEFPNWNCGDLCPLLLIEKLQSKTLTDGLNSVFGLIDKCHSVSFEIKLWVPSKN